MTEGAAKRFALRSGQRVDVAEQRRAQLMEARERQFHLRLHADRAQDSAAAGAIGGLL